MEPWDKDVKSRNYNVRVTHHKNAYYTASWGTKFSTIPTPSMASALRYLANVLDAQGVFGSTTENIELLSQNHCQYCGAPIIFARLPPPSEKWLAFETRAVDASLIKGCRAATFDTVGLTLRAIWPKRPEGDVWVPHPEVCGQKLQPPTNPTLKERWHEYNHGSAEETERAIAELQEDIAMLRGRKVA